MMSPIGMLTNKVSIWCHLHPQKLLTLLHLTFSTFSIYPDALFFLIPPFPLKTHLPPLLYMTHFSISTCLLSLLCSGSCCNLCRMATPCQLMRERQVGLGAFIMMGTMGFLSSLGTSLWLAMAKAEIELGKQPNTLQLRGKGEFILMTSTRL